MLALFCGARRKAMRMKVLCDSVPRVQNCLSLTVYKMSRVFKQRVIYWLWEELCKKSAHVQENVSGKDLMNDVINLCQCCM